MSAQTAVNDELIRFVSKIVSEQTGVILGEKQKGMVQGRIGRRLREVGVATHDEYLKYIKANLEKETQFLVSLLTTHHTFFFREFEHFEHLLEKTIPRVLAEMKETGRKKMRILSAACSKGHEVYSLAMFLKKNLPPGTDFEVVGGDVCAESVQFAKNGVYKWEEVKTVPAMYLQGNWARGTGSIADFVKVVDGLKKHCKFGMMNLVDVTGFDEEKFDVVFCRNVFIYFEREQVQRSTQALLDRLLPTGDLIIGLSESLNGLDLPVIWEGPSVYRLKSGVDAKKAKPMAATAAPAGVPPAKPSPAPLPAPAPVAAAPIKIFAVDDSPTVLKLIEKMCKESGFEFLGAAKDGAEALRMLTGPNAPKPSVITLDLHMPNMNGLEFLKAYRALAKTPVIVVSSINREEQALAQQALSSGANDYVEKPAMDRWKETTSELVAKIKAIARQANATTGPSDLDRAFVDKTATASRAPSRKWVVLAGPADLARAKEFAKNNSKRVEMIVQTGNSPVAASGGTKVVSVFEATRLVGQNGQDYCLLMLGEPDESACAFAVRIKVARVLLEETAKSAPQAVALRKELGPSFDRYPLMSFTYEADRVVKTAGTPAGGRKAA